MNNVQGGLSLGMAISLGQIALNNQTVAVLHQSMPRETQRRTGAGGFLLEPVLRVGGRGMGGVGQLLALEVDLGVAVVAGHRFGLWFGLGGLIVATNRMCRWFAWFPIVRRAGLRLKAFHRGPSFDQRAIDREVLIRQERRHHAMRQDLITALAAIAAETYLSLHFSDDHARKPDQLQQIPLPYLSALPT